MSQTSINVLCSTQKAVAYLVAKYLKDLSDLLIFFLVKQKGEYSCNDKWLSVVLPPGRSF